MSEHYFSASPTSEGKTRTKTLFLGGVEFLVQLAPGVFSNQRLDPGTQVLLERTALPETLPLPHPDLASIPKAQPLILDLGCGWGPISLFLAHRFPQASVVALDVNERARQLCAQNARLNGLENITVVDPGRAHELLAGQGIDLLWSNPPIRIGKAALHDLLHQWLGILKPSGRADLVVSKNLGADSLSRWLEEQSFAVQRVAAARGYRVLQVIKPN